MSRYPPSPYLVESRNIARNNVSNLLNSLFTVGNLINRSINIGGNREYYNSIYRSIETYFGSIGNVRDTNLLRNPNPFGINDSINNLRNILNDEIRRLDEEIRRNRAIVENQINSYNSILPNYISRASYLENQDIINRLNNIRDTRGNPLISSYRSENTGISDFLRIFGIIMNDLNNIGDEIVENERNLENVRNIIRNDVSIFRSIIFNDKYEFILRNIGNGDLSNRYDSLRNSIGVFLDNIGVIVNIDNLRNTSVSLRNSINDLNKEIFNNYINNKLLIVRNLLVLLRNNDSDNYISNLGSTDDLRVKYNDVDNLISNFRNIYERDVNLISIEDLNFERIDEKVNNIERGVYSIPPEVVRRKRLDEINRQRGRIEETLLKLRAIEELKNSLNFQTFNNNYGEINNSITTFKNSLNNDYTDAYGLESRRLGIDTDISNLKTNLLNLERARMRIVEVNNMKILITNVDVINKKMLLNDVEIENMYNLLLGKLNEFIRDINEYTATEIDNKIDNDIKNVYNNFDTQLNIRFKRLEARNTLNEKINFLTEKRELINVDFYVEEKLPDLLKLQEDMRNYIDILINQISISDITAKVDLFSLKSASLIDEIEQEKMRRMNLIGGMVSTYEYRPAVMEQYIYKNKLRYYEWISIYNYNLARGIMEENVISRDGIYGNHYKKTIGEIIVRYSSKVSNDNSPSYLFDKDLSKNCFFGTGEGNLYNQAGDYMGNSRVMIDGSYVNGEFISFKYSQRFKLLRYAFKLGENYEGGVGSWEIYYKDENDIYKELDRNDSRLTLEDYKNTYNREDVYNKFLVSNNISANEYLIIFTGMVGSSVIGNRGIELKQIYLWTGIESSVKTTNEDNISPPRT